MEEVSESNWLLHKLWQSVEGFCSKVCGLVQGLERVEILQELRGLVDNQGGHAESSAEDSESTSSWRTRLEGTE